MSTRISPRSLGLAGARQSVILDDVDLDVRRAGGSASSARTASASRRCCASSPARSGPTPARCPTAPPDAARRLPARRSPSGGAGETVRDFLGRRTGVARRSGRARRGDASRWPPATTGADDRVLATRSSAGSRSARADFDSRIGEVWAELGLADAAARPADDDACPAARRRARGLAVAAARPLRRVPARRADQRPRPRRPGDRLERWVDVAAGRGWSSSATTASSSAASVTHVAELDEFTHGLDAVRRRLGRVPRRARARRPARPRALRGVRREEVDLPAGPSASASGRRRV